MTRNGYISGLIFVSFKNMAIDRAQWQQRLDKFRMPRWLCPTCNQGHFALAPKSFFYLPSRGGYVRLSEDPEDRGRDLPLRFSAFAQCDNSACQETATISGSGTENWVEDFPSPQLYCEFSPEYIYPSPDLFSIPVATPSNLRRAIQSAFVLSWGEYEACVNRIRTSVEMVLDSLPIPRTRPNHGGHESFLNLYERIENVDEKFPHIGAIKQHLQACRLLGNVGSHSNDVTKEDVFDALELLEAIVLVIYGEQARVTDLAESIVARHRK